MKIKKMNWFVRLITGSWASAITLAPFGIYIREEYWYWQNYNVSRWNKLINHESIHWKQQIEMLIIPFYLWYFIEWFLKTGLYGRKAYYNISFERESYQNEKNLEYLKTRKKFAWLKLL